jgi:hypothetical protein
MADVQPCGSCGLNLELVYAVNGRITCHTCGQVTAVAVSPELQGPVSTSGWAIASLVTGLLCMGPIPVFLGILALNDIRLASGRKTGRGLAWAGIALGGAAMAALAVFVGLMVLTVRSVNESYRTEYPVLMLSELQVAEETFHEQDSDNNGANDYWTADVAELFSAQSSAWGLHFADAAPWKGPGQKVSAFGYWICAMTTGPDGARYRQDPDGDGQATTNPSRYGFCLYPARYGRATIHTYIIDERGTIWYKDLGGRPQMTFPKDPAAEGWRSIPQPTPVPASEPASPNP